ncbi:MAG: TerC family protein [Lactobacillus sp.]|nr:TerC family protein [Lactobacillus sp.]
MNFFNLYAPFFDLNNWRTVITSESDWMLILTLILMECLLSVDNAVVLAAQTQVLPTKLEREKSLLYGLWGAYIFRFLIIGIGTFLINFWEIKILGAAYLFYLSGKYFWDVRHPHEEKHEEHHLKKKNSKISLFWRTVISIEAMDIVFSIDSVLASLAISNNPVIVLLGGMIGILCMRGVAEVIIRLMEIIPELQTLAYVLIGVIALKLFLSIPAIDFEIPNAIFAAIVFGLLIICIIFHFMKKR